MRIRSPSSLGELLEELHKLEGAAAATVVGAGERLPTRQQIVRVLRARRLKKPWDAVRLRVLRHLSG
jgi:hypothetical protein